nr:type IV pilin PilA [uncultured bacterium]
MKKKGFTLIELMIVVAIIAIIAAIAIPNLLRSRMQSNESAAIGNLRTCIGAQVAYNAANSVYATTFAMLTTATPPFLDGDWSQPKSGYTFAIAGTPQAFTTTGAPQTPGTTGNRFFFTDASGVIRYNQGAAATSASSPIGQ